MANITVTFTEKQVEELLYIIRQDTRRMKQEGNDRSFIALNDRIEEKILKAQIEARKEGKK